MAEKTRLDTAVFEAGLAESREKAKALIMAGQIFVNGVRSDKAGTQVKATDKIELHGEKLKYVSRGGLKLEKAISAFNLNLKDKVCMDVGASTGGFTDCMLQNGAKRVYCIDVGYGQLAWKLRCDNRVKNLERKNFRYLTFEELGERAEFASVDVSFISLSHILPNLYEFTTADAQCVCLIKPQFEAGKDKVGKKGVVRDESVHIEVINHVFEMIKENSFKVCALTFSPVKGPEGNIEYLVLIKKTTPAENTEGAADAEDLPNIDVEKIVKESHRELDTKQ